MLQLLRNFLFPNKKNTSTMVDENKLISLMQNFTGQKFQWIKTNNPSLLGKVVTCRTIEPKGERFFAVFDDGSTVDTSQLNTNLMLIHGDSEPLSLAEVQSIVGPKRPAANTSQGQPRKIHPPEVDPIHGSGNFSENTRAQSNAPSPNMFSLFNSEQSNLSLNLSVRLPEKKLLKLMYSSAENKDKFLSELADYLHSVINKQVIKDSVTSLLVPQNIKKEKTPSRPLINLTEVDESK